MFIAKLLILILFSSSSAFAAENCSEISEQQMAEWLAIKPATPALWFLYKAKKIVDAEKKYALTLGNDKTAHCYLGCRINDDVNFETARFVAWQKEYNDATDCNSKTYFDVIDYEATIKGTECTTRQCAEYCQSIY